MEFDFKNKYDSQDLVKIMELLRSENGCPWDKEQTHSSIRGDFIEETYEALEAIDKDDVDMMKEELGDVLLQVVFHSQIEKEKGSFDFDDVCDGICKKLILRHPHIFKNEKANNSSDVLKIWDSVKKKEKNQKTATETLKAVPACFPALMRAQKVQKRAAKTGFDYGEISYAWSDMESEVKELSSAIENKDAENIKEELGDILFSVCNVARFLGLDSEEALTASTEKFISRFEVLEGLANKNNLVLENCSMEELDVLWRQAKDILTKK